MWLSCRAQNIVGSVGRVGKNRQIARKLEGEGCDTLLKRSKSAFDLGDAGDRSTFKKQIIIPFKSSLCQLDKEIKRKLQSEESQNESPRVKNSVRGGKG